MGDKYHFEELDTETRNYLMAARERQGKGLPGIYAGKSNYLPAIGIILGFVVMIGTLVLTFPPTEHPVKEAMLQTAGFMLGGWMIIAALRVWVGGRSGRYAGHFVYADPEYMYEADGSMIEVTDLYDLRDAKAVQNFNDGKYQNTSITVKLGKDRKIVEVNDEERGRRLAVYLNAVSYMRDGGEDGKDEELRNLTPEAMGAVAKQVARTGQFPDDPKAAEEQEKIHIPRPKKEGRASTGILAIIITVIVGALMFTGFKYVNVPFRDEAVFDQIKSLPSKEQPPALRQYLLNPDFKAHRDEAQQMLDAYYDANARTSINGTDKAMGQALGDLVHRLKSKPAPVISLVVAEEESPAGQEPSRTQRESAVQNKLADKWGATIGDEMVVFVALTNSEDANDPNAPDRTAKGNIEVRWRFTPAGAITYTVFFRKSPDEEPFMVKEGTVSSAKDAAPEQRAEQTVQAMTDVIIQATVGTAKLRPTPPPDDF
ncbi:MAG TPA: hypothetical protein VKD71_10435 [Gemmataceae bacterium]|nr:hypothetical protein [Gemmataceae bacterium]